MNGETHVSGAEEALAEVARIRSATRDGLLSMKWHTSAIWGLVFLVVVLLWRTFDNELLNTVYWFVAVPTAIVITWKLEYPLPQAAGSRPFGPSFFAVTACMVVGAFGTWWVFDERVSALVWYSVLLIGFAAFALLDRHFWVAAGIAVLWVWGVLVWLPMTDTAGDNEIVLALFSTAIGAGLLGTGFGRRLGRSG